MQLGTNSSKACVKNTQKELVPYKLNSFIAVFLRKKEVDNLIGDILEEYLEFQVPENGLMRAKLWYLFQVVRVVPFIISRMPKMSVSTVDGERREED